MRAKTFPLVSCKAALPPSPSAVTPSAKASSPAPRVNKGKAREVIPESSFSPRSECWQSLTEEILSLGAAAAAQHRCDEFAAMGPPQGRSFGNGKINNWLSNLISIGGMGGRTVGGASGFLHGMGGRTVGTPSPSPPTSGGCPLVSPISQTVRAPPRTGCAGGHLSGMSSMAGLESLLGGLGGLGPGSRDRKSVV